MKKSTARASGAVPAVSIDASVIAIRTELRRVTMREQDDRAHIIDHDARIAEIERATVASAEVGALLAEVKAALRELRELQEAAPPWLRQFARLMTAQEAKSKKNKRAA
jgi:hypothetical protein